MNLFGLRLRIHGRFYLRQVEPASPSFLSGQSPFWVFLDAHFPGIRLWTHFLDLGPSFDSREMGMAHSGMGPNMVEPGLTFIEHWLYARPCPQHLATDRQGGLLFVASLLPSVEQVDESLSCPPPEVQLQCLLGKCAGICCHRGLRAEISGYLGNSPPPGL